MRQTECECVQMVPTSLIKRLATRKYVLGDEEEEDQDENIEFKALQSKEEQADAKAQVHDYCYSSVHNQSQTT